MTLIELLISMALFSVATAAIFGLLAYGRHLFGRSDARVDSQRAALRLAARMTRELSESEAGQVTVTYPAGLGGQAADLAVSGATPRDALGAAHVDPLTGRFLDLGHICYYRRASDDTVRRWSRPAPAPTAGLPALDAAVLQAGVSAGAGDIVARQVRQLYAVDFAALTPTDQPQNPARYRVRLVTQKGENVDLTFPVTFEE